MCLFTINCFNDTIKWLLSYYYWYIRTSSRLSCCQTTSNVTFRCQFSSLGASHPLQVCRLCFLQIQLEPPKALYYVQESQSKKVIYRTILTNQYNNIGSTFNQLINSGVTHPVGVLAVPYISSAQKPGVGDYQRKPPSNSCPSTSAPMSLLSISKCLLVC